MICEFSHKAVKKTIAAPFLTPLPAVTLWLEWHVYAIGDGLIPG